MALFSNLNFMLVEHMIQHEHILILEIQEEKKYLDQNNLSSKRK